MAQCNTLHTLVLQYTSLDQVP